MPKSVRHILGKQFLITSFADQKIQVINLLKSEYDSNSPIYVNNSFLHFTAHIYYRSVVIDLFSLFGAANNNNKFSFYHLPIHFKNVIRNEAFEAMESLLQEHQNHIEVIKILRHEQIAHYDFEKENVISLNFDNLEALNELLSLAKRIITLIGGSTIEKKESMGFGFGRKSERVISLESLVKKAAR